MKITVVGTGYVGLSLSVLLSEYHEVVALDIDKERIIAINNKKSTIQDPDISYYLDNKKLNLRATSDKFDAYKDSFFVIIATPTNYDPTTNYFNTDTIDAVTNDIVAINPQAVIIIKSTVPVGFTDNLRIKFKCVNIFFSPEFLREGSALHDNLYPSRIIIGGKTNAAKEFAQLLNSASINNNSPILYTNNTEAEAIKLFANTYLAMRVAYFNEIDNYCIVNGLNAKEIIDGVSLDPRIGNHYHNPSFGYGGYCLPKDSKQLLANYKGVPQSLISAIVISNRLRKDFIANEILNLKPGTVGIFRLTMKSGSDNHRSSSIQGIIKRLMINGVKIVVYEPFLETNDFFNAEVIRDLDLFKSISDIILANRSTDVLFDVSHKVYTRDIYGND